MVRVNELLTNIKGKIPIILKIDDLEIDAVTFRGTKSFFNDWDLKSYIRQHNHDRYIKDFKLKGEQ